MFSKSVYPQIRTSNSHPVRLRACLPLVECLPSTRCRTLLSFQSRSVSYPKIKKFAHSFWNISIYNVLGRNNPYSVFFVTDDGEVKAYQSSIFSIPIPTITYNFKF